MKFRTELEVPPFPFQINYDSEIVLLGSCFAENVGELLSKYKFSAVINPHGILFNPFSLNEVLKRAITGSPIESEYLVQSYNQWYSYLHHSDLLGRSEEALVDNIKRADHLLLDKIEKANCVFISLGTAWVYELKDSGKIVANCHKKPAQEFRKQLLTSHEVIGALNDTVALLHNTNPQLKVIFTVSPVRHIKDGIVENSRSKALLVSMVYECIEEQKQCFYFPSYELLMDDLRDYRFYAEDLIHPSTKAISYVWEKFSQGFFSANTVSLNKSIGKMVSAMEHRFRAPSEDTVVPFAQQHLQQCEVLEEQIGKTLLKVEIDYFKKLLGTYRNV